MWVQVGNKLDIYTDGATKAESFGTSDFANNPMYEELYTWDIISTDVIPEGGLVNLHITKGDVKPVAWKEVAIDKNIGQIKNETYKNIETKDNLISLNQDVEGNLTNNVLAGIYADGVNSTIIANDGLQIQVDNNIASPVGIYAGNGGSVKFTSTSGNLDVLTKTLDGGNTLTNAIWLDPSKNGGEKLQITAANTNITMEGGYGGNGIAIQKTDRWGENSKVSTQGGHITIQGNVNIKGADAEGNADWGIQGNPTNVLSRFNNAGILVDVNNSSVEVNGNVDMDVYGNGVTVTGDNSTVTIKKGGSITVPHTIENGEHSYGYYALAAYDGTINMNADATENVVKLNGDIFATKEGTINLGLVTKDSVLNGIIDNGGTANVTLKNGATWTNVANNDRYYQDSEDKGSNGRSHVTKLQGGTNFDDAGTIIQKANSDHLYIDTLSGAVKVKYDSCAVDESNVVKVDGGNVTINEATAGSLVGLYTPSAGIDTTDVAEVTAVLNAIANKLYYNGYMQRGATLQGYVTIGEGITSSSITNNYAKEITFTEHGQGTTTGEGTGVNPDSGNEGGAGDGNTGDEDIREPFTPVPFPFEEGKEPTLNSNAVWKDSADYTDGVIINVAKQKINKDDGTVLQIQKTGDKDITAVYVAGGTGTTRLQNTKTDMNIITKVTADNGRANAVWLDPSAAGGEKFSLNASAMSTAKNINISLLGGYGGNGIVISSSTGNKEVAKASTIQITGNVNIKGEYDNQWGIGANPENFDARNNNAGILVEVDKGVVKATSHGKLDIAVYGNGITVDGAGASVEFINGGNIIVPTDTVNNLNYYSMAAYDGTISYGWREPNNNFQVTTKNCNVTGNLLVDSETAAINMALNGSNSELKGAVINNEGGTAWLFLTDGAKWTNVSNNTNEIGAVSHLSKLDAHYNNNCNSVAKIIQTPTSGDIIIDEFGGGGNIRGNQTVYAGNLKVEYELDENSPTVIKGGSIVIEDSFKGSKLTVYTPYSNAVTKDNLWSVFNSLANKIYYHGAKYLIDQTTGEVLLDENGNPKQQDGDGSLDAYVQMGEGLTASSVAAELTAKGILKDGAVSEDIDDIEYKGGSLNADIKWNGTTGQGSLTGNLENGTGYYESNTGSDAFMNAKGAYMQPIYGVLEKDGKWMGKGITTGDGVYNFTDAVTVFETNNKKIDGGAWHSAVGVAISAHGDLGNRDKEYKTVVNMNNNDLVITNTTTGSGASISAIDGGKVVINDPGNIIINEKGHGPTAGIFANSGGEVYIDNADGGVVTIRTSAGGGGGPESGYGTSGAGIKTMNGVSDVRSYVTITGMVDIVADLNTCNNEAISAVASTVEVGGGNLQAINGAWAAIRAYGEFVSDNAAIVNVNVLKDSAGNITGAGNNKTTIFGDFVTNGGMGTLGYITVGLNGEDSYWTGNYADTRGYGVTKGQEGNVTVLMKNGATWTGFSDGEMNVTMEGEGTTWLGYNVAERKADDMGNTNGGLVLTLKDGAVWQNAITTEQKYNDTVQDAKVYDFNGDGGFIDMTGNKTFIGKNSASHADGSNGVSFKNTSIIFNDTPQETGNLVITNYSGDTTVIYRRDNEDVTKVLGGTTTIKNATAGSNITLSTDNVGIDMTNTTEVTNVLDNLAEKLFYTAYATENERNLSGKVQIAEGLTTSSVGKYFGDIEFSTVDGQGSMKDGSLTKPGSTPSVPPSGDEDDEKPEDKPVVPEVKPEQKPVVEEEIKGAITGDSLTDTTDENPYKDLIGKDDKDNAVIDFGKLDKEDSKVDIVKIESEEEGGKNSVIAAAPSESVIIDVAGKDLAVNGSATSEALGIQAIGGDVTIKDAGYVTITANAGETGSASAIYAKDGDVTIENSDTVKLIAKGNANDAVLHADTNSNVNIKGKVEITNTNGKVAVEVTDGSTVSFGGGVIDAGKEGTAIVVTGDDSKVVANTDDKGESKKNGLKIKGNIQIGEVPASTFNLRRSIMLLASGNKPYGEFTFDGAEDTWEGDYTGANDATLVLALKNGATWTGAKESNGNLDLTIETNGSWKNTSDKATTVTTLSGEGGFVEMSEGDLAISTYNGKTTFVYANDYGKDVEDDKLIKGGVVDIKAAADGSVATMRTNNIGTSDKDEVERVLKALAKKLAYSGYDGSLQNQKLTGKVQIMEGMTGSSVTREGLIKFDATSGQGSLDDSKDVTIDYKGDYIYGDSETAMMKGAKSAMASTVMMWRSESNDLLQRMGDVRLATEESGVWAKYYGGKYEMDAQNTNFSTNYKAYQVGYDKAVGNGWNVGVAVSHNEGDSRYDRGGEGEMTVTSFSVYGNKDYGDGRYLGLILKGSQLKNEYEVFNNDGYKLEGDFKTWGTSISAEYGKRIEKGNGFYFDPSVELTIGHVQGKDYTATSDLLKNYGKTATMQVEQDDFNSIIGRIGFGIGQRTERASYYAKLALAHEFGGDFDTNYTAEETKGTSISFGDTWYEMQLGGTAKLSDNSLLYATYERSFGGDVTEKWRVDAGLRVTF